MYISLYISQKSSGNGKDLLQRHVSTTWVGRSHTHLRRYNTCAVTQIGVGSRDVFVHLALIVFVMMSSTCFVIFWLFLLTPSRVPQFSNVKSKASLSDGLPIDLPFARMA